MLKKFKVTEAFHIYLHCDKCGEQMKLDKVTVVHMYKSIGKYVCPVCGFVQISDLSYPKLLINTSSESEVCSQEETELVMKSGYSQEKLDAIGKNGELEW